MKKIKVTLKLKQELTRHFTRGGSPEDVSGDLARIPLEERKKLHQLWAKRLRRP